jgi:hypothetical protein
MFENIIQLNKIGKELGLSKKEINKVLLFDNSRHPSLYKILMIIIFVFVGVIVIILGIEASRHIYPAGTLYSTVKIKDFKSKK